MAIDFWFEGGRLSLDFIGTAGARVGELLPAPERLGAWLVAAGLTDRPIAASATELAEAHALRAALERVVRGALGERELRAADVTAVNAAAARPTPSHRLVLHAGDLARSEPAPGVGDCLGAIARDAVDLLTGPQRPLVRACAAEGCSGIYVDLSRGARRKWCTGAGCGNRVRVAAHRRRRAEDA